MAPHTVYLGMKAIRLVSQTPLRKAQTISLRLPAALLLHARAEASASQTRAGAMALLGFRKPLVGDPRKTASYLW